MDNRVRAAKQMDRGRKSNIHQHPQALHVRHKPHMKVANSSSYSRKSFNNLSIDNPVRDLMDMHFGTKR